MKGRRFFWFASCLAIGIGGCATTHRPPPRPDAEQACAEWRWIGISQPGARCPDIPGWAGRPLFPQLSPVSQKTEEFCADDGFRKEDYCAESRKTPDPELIQELNRFCVYEPAERQPWKKASPPPPTANAGLARLDRDCAALSLSGDADPPAENREHQSRLLFEQAGAVPFPVVNPLGVRLAFLDTEPTRASAADRQGRSPHGYTLAHIAHHMVCNGEGCAAQVATRLALPILKFDPRYPKLNRRDLVRGGFLGMQSDLAEAIRDEVDAWQQERQRSGSKQNLILNLSLAWDGDVFGGLDATAMAELKAGTQAVYRALQYAAGFDALVLAAAGNQKAAPCNNHGPLLPAAWERGAAQEKRCGGELQSPQLLYAVGGVQSEGRPIVNARPGGMPRRAAYGDRALVACADGEPTAMLTGSSVSTAVASAIAAVVWSTYPDLSSSKVMEILDTSGDALSMPPDFWFDMAGSRPEAVRRLSLCSALQRACEDQGRDCRISIECPRWQPVSPARLGSVHPADWVPDSCQPWTAPQPEKPPCLSCGPPDG